MAEYAYPSELAQFVSGHWGRSSASGENLSSYGARPEVLEQLISACYQASMLKEELRPVTFRLILCRPECFEEAQERPGDFHILPFEVPREFHPRELRSLSQAANFYRSIIGVSLDAHDRPQIWGIIHTGPRWLREMYGGRRASTPLPPSVVICVNGAGHLEVCRGSILVGQVRDGIVFDESMNVFQSRWLPEQFAAERQSLIALYEASRSEENISGADLDPALPRQLAQQFVKRILGAVQTAEHGGTLIMVPDELRDSFLVPNPYVNVKYRFAESEARRRYRTLLVSIMKHLSVQNDPAGTAGWAEYASSENEELNVLDEALFEMSHLIAGLAAVDGAVLMTKRFEVLGFGAEITCHGVDVSRVQKALDIEGESTLEESPDGVGTRHRSAFRFVQSVPSSIVAVISQDGEVRFVRSRNEAVTYWSHRPSLQVTP